MTTALQKQNLHMQPFVECDQALEGGRAAIWELSGKPDPPTALICINDLAAIGAMSALREMGVRVPEQVSVLVCEDIYMARFVNPPFTTVKLDCRSLGKMAFEVLERMSESKHRKGTQTLLQTTLVVRASTAGRNPKPVIWNRG